MPHPRPRPAPARPATALAAGLLVAATATAQTTQRVEVDGSRPRTSLIRITDNVEAAPASTTVIDRRAIDALSVSTYGDLFRNLPGFYVNDLGQGLVPYELRARGFQGDHSRDIAFFLDGVPLNITGSRRTNGYADLAMLIAETVDRVEIVRGPFSAAAGNHAVAGSVSFHTDRHTPSQVKVDIDGFGRTRVLPVLSAELGPGRMLAALDLAKGRGYHEQSDVDRVNVLLRYGFALGPGQLSLRAQSYDAEADAPGYLPYDGVVGGTVDRRRALSPGIGDDNRQTNLVVGYRSDDSEGASGPGGGWQASLYAVRNDRVRWAYFDLTTPVGSARDLGRDADTLDQKGFAVRKHTRLGSSLLQLGLQFNDEHVDTATSRTDARRVGLGDATVSAQREVSTTTTSVFGEFQFLPLEGLKLVTAARWDRIDFDVRLRPLDDAFAGPAGTRFGDRKQQFSPKLGLGWSLVGGAQPIELFANAARGLKSPYPYGDFNRLPATRVTPLTSFELGLQGVRGPLGWRVSLWRTEQADEALFDAANRFLGSRRTDRGGFDAEARIALAPHLRLSAHYSGVHARIRDGGVNDRLPDVPEWIAGLGVAGTLHGGSARYDWSIDDTVVGPQAVVASNALRTRAFHRVVGRIVYADRSGKGPRLAFSATAYDRPFEETQVVLGGVRGVLAKPRLKALATAQYLF